MAVGSPQAHLVIFDSNVVNNIDGLRVLAIDPDKPAKRTVTLVGLSAANARTASSAWFKERTITVSIDISQPSRGAAEASLDSLLAILNGKEKELIVDQSNMKRKYTATFTNYSINERGGSYMQIDLIFECSDALGYDLNYSLLVSATGATGNYRNDSFTIGGSAEYQAIYGIVTYTALTGASNGTVAISNPALLQTVTITRSWTAGDQLIIDGQTEQATVNGTLVAYTGKIPDFKLGIGYLVYTDDFTTRTINYLVRYKRRWV